MACKKFGSKSDAFQRQGQAWFCTTGLPSDITIEVGEMSFHLHKFPLLSKSRLLEKLITEQQSAGGEEEGECSINLPDVPGGSRSFELVAKFCYGSKIELNASNVVFLRCAADYLQMNEEVAEGNLISQTEAFLNQVVLRSWKDSLKALQTCEDLLPHAEDLDIVKRCIDSLAVTACTDPKLNGWPIQNPDGSVLWNGISTGAIPTSHSSDWWYEDVSSLRLSTFKRLMAVMESRGIRAQLIAGSLSHYAKRYIHGLQKRHNPRAAPAAPAAPAAEEEQRDLLEEIESLLPFQKGVASTKFLCGVLRTALILRARPACLSNLERRIGTQLDQATLEDLLMPTFSYSMETLYDVDCVQRILEHFLALDQAAAAAAAGASPVLADDEHFIGSPSLTPITAVAKLIDGYLAEVAPDVNLKLPKFESLAAAVPEYARPLDDGLYRAIDVYLKGHPWLTEAEREQLCRLMDCQKLSLEACTHAAQNERLPLRVVVQVLFFEQLQLRSSIAGCFLVSDNLDGSMTLRSGTMAPCEGGGGWTGTVRENQVLKVGMDHMRMRVSELEKECSTMRQQIEKLGQGKNIWRRSVPKKLGFSFGFNSQMCSARENSVSGEHHRSSVEKLERLQAKVAKPKRKKTANE